VQRFRETSPFLEFRVESPIFTHIIGRFDIYVPRDERFRQTVGLARFDFETGD